MTNFEKLIEDLESGELGTIELGGCKHCFYKFGNCYGKHCEEGVAKWLKMEVNEKDYEQRNETM